MIEEIKKQIEEQKEPELKYFNVSVSGEYIGVEAVNEEDAEETIRLLIGDKEYRLFYEAREQ